MSCIVCDSHKITKHDKVIACQQCGHVYRDFGKINEKNYYTNEYRQKIVKNNEIIRPKEKLKQRALNIYKIINDYIKNDFTFLEVGFGEGHFAEVYAEQNGDKNYYCCEMSELHSQEAKKRGLQVFNCGFQDIDTEIRFDAIASFDVLEHIRNPYEYIEKLETLLSVNGVAIIQVPTDRRLHSETPFDGHYHYFSKQSLNKLMGNKFRNLLFYKSQRGECANGPEFLTVWKKEKE
jgi:cyclopropane fatty-acyl-phospholipid synthase-like methyltransferase